MAITFADDGEAQPLVESLRPVIQPVDVEGYRSRTSRGVFHECADKPAAESAPLLLTEQADIDDMQVFTALVDIETTDGFVAFISDKKTCIRKVSDVVAVLSREL